MRTRVFFCEVFGVVVVNPFVGRRGGHGPGPARGLFRPAGRAFFGGPTARGPKKKKARPVKPAGLVVMGVAVLWVGWWDGGSVGVVIEWLFSV